MQKTEKPLSEWTDAEVYMECAKMLRLPLPVQDGCAELFSRRVLDATVERGFWYSIINAERGKAFVIFNVSGKEIEEGGCEGKPLDRAICEAAIEALRQENGNG